MENNNPTPTTDIATIQAESECKLPPAQPASADSNNDILANNIESAQSTDQPDNSITKVESQNKDLDPLTQHPDDGDKPTDCQEKTPLDSTDKPVCDTDQQSEKEKISDLQIEQHAVSETPSSSNSDSVVNASTEVLLDVSITDRLACLGIGTNENQSDGETDNHDGSSSLSAEKPADSSPEKNQTLAGTEKTAELSRSILAGEISDNSERSIELEDEPSDYVDDRVNSGDVSDEEMFIEEQEEEDVEEEEEFHEVDEEKHKTSQESVGGDRSSSSVSSKAKSTPPINSKTSEPKTAGCSDKEQVSSAVPISSPAPTQESSHPNTDPSEDHKDNGIAEVRAQATKSADWADIMLSDSQTGEGECDEKNQLQSKPEDGSNKEDVKDAEKKELDLDEDVKNPQYIPKKGVFYEHDDRSHDSKDRKQPLSTSVKKDEETVEVKESSSNSKKTSQEKPNEKQRGGRRQRSETDRWNHDLFRDEKQKPKSKSELINAYGYDIRHERTPRNPADRGQQRGGSNNGNNVTNSDRQQSGPDAQRSRTNRDNRTPRQSQPSNRSGDRRPNRRQDSRGNRGDASGTPLKRDAYNGRPNRSDAKDIKPQHDQLDGVKQSFQNTQIQSTTLSSTRRENLDGSREKNARNENRGRRQNSNDRPSSNSTDDKLPPITTVMPPITTWSNKIEDMVKEEANRKESPSRYNQHQSQNIGNSAQKTRPNDQWPQNQPNKNPYHDRPVRNVEENRHPQSYNARRYQDRDDGAHKSTQFINRNHYTNDRSNQHHPEWRRNNQYNSYAKPNEYEPIKTQTFENSRLQQINMNNRSNFRDAREIINERRMQNQQNFQPKIQPGSSGVDQQMQQQRQLQHQQHQQIVQQQRQQLLQHQHLMQHQQQAHQHLRQQQQQQQQPPSSTPQQIPQNQTQQPPMGSAQPPQQLQNQHLQSQRQHQQPNAQPHQTQPRQNMVMNNPVEVSQESGRLTTNHSNSSDLINSRPIIKTDAYTGANVAPHSQQQPPQQIQHHSQNHRPSGGPITQQGPNSASSHLVPSHMSAGSTHAQYYASPNNPRESATAAAALASAYIGYMPSGHSVMDATRYHMTSQQLSDHGYMTSPGQTNDVAAASVLHQQGMYADTTAAGGTVASSAYLAQAGSTISPSANIPVTGAGPPPLAPVSYLQHSQYAPPPYSNPYSQPQHNQAPPQSSHAYPYWTYI